MKKNIIAFLSLMMLASCGVEKQEVSETVVVPETQKTISVTSSIIPLSSVINTVGGEYVSVNTIIPAGVSPHWFDLSAQDVVAMENSDIAFIIGLDQIDGFLKKPLENKKYIAVAEGMELLEAAAHDHGDHEDEEHHDEEDEHEDEEHHDDHSVDAHVWLGKNNIIEIAETVRDELSAILPEQAELFAENTEIFRAELETIYSDFIVQNADKTPREFIVFHDAYNYLLQSVEIDSNLKIPFSENVLHEAGTAHMVELIEEVELHGLKNIFSEPQFSDGNLQSFATEYNLIVSTLDPIGTNDSATGYIQNLQTNLDNLALIYE